MAFNRILGFAAFAAIALTGCETAGAAGAGVSGAPNAAAAEEKDGSLPTAEEIAAMETLTGVEFPPFADDLEAYCARIMPPPAQLIEHVAGYASDYTCGGLPQCVSPVLMDGYAFVEVDIGGNEYLTPGLYRITLEEDGSPDCGPYARYIDDEQARVSVLRRPKPPNGKCVAFNPINEFTSRYVYRSEPSKTSSVKGYRIRKTSRVIYDNELQRVVANSTDVYVQSSDEAGWIIHCRNGSRNPIGESIPPLRQ